MKKAIMLMMGIFFISLAFAGLSGVVDNKTVPRDSFTTEERQKLEALNIDTWDYEDRQTGDYAIRKLIADDGSPLPEVKVLTTYENCVNWSTHTEIIPNNTYMESEPNKTLWDKDKTGYELVVQDQCIEWETLNYTSQEINDMLDEKMIERMRLKASAELARDARSSTDTREGSVVIANR